MFNWRTVTHSQSPKFMVNGTELCNAIVPNTGYRFQICVVRTYDRGAEWPHGERYLIRDAETVNDQQIRDGVRPAVVHNATDERGALEWYAKQIGCTVEDLLR